jgi:nitrite reductase/ring-hydroxylating ferredoxin subunit
MAEFVKVGKASDIDEGGVLGVEAKGRELALFKLDGQIYCLADLCTHEEAPLCEGYIEGGEIECPWHGARFDIKTGAATEGPATEPVATYPVRLSGDDVEVELED